MTRDNLVRAICCIASAKGWLAVTLDAVCVKLGITPHQFNKSSAGTPFRDLVNAAAAQCPGKPTPTHRKGKHAPTPEVRKELLFQAAVAIAGDHGASTVRAIHIARHTGVSESLVKYHLYPLTKLRQALVAYAVEQNDAGLLSTLLTCAESRAAPHALRLAAAEVLAND